jgi:hypothetical protein
VVLQVESEAAYPVAWPFGPGDDLATVVSGDLPELPDASARAVSRGLGGESRRRPGGNMHDGHRPSSPDILPPLEVAARKMTVRSENLVHQDPDPWLSAARWAATAGLVPALRTPQSCFANFLSLGCCQVSGLPGFLGLPIGRFAC